MLRKFGLSAIAFLALLLLMPAPHANAAVRFGVTVGVPAYPVAPYSYNYADPYAYPPAYAYPNGYYEYPAPYVYPNTYYGWYGGPVGVRHDLYRRDFDRRNFDRGHEFRGEHRR
jgi:hypothetical protein